MSLFHIFNRFKYSNSRFRVMVKGIEFVFVSSGLGFSVVYSHYTKKVQLEDAFSHRFTSHRLVSFLYNSAFRNSIEYFRLLTDFPQTLCRLR